MLKDDILKGETDILEFKVTPSADSSKWLKTVVAFANGRGGRIVFGVSNDREVKGLEGDLFAMKDAIANAVADACEPIIPVTITGSTIEGKQIIVLEVPSGRMTPYYLKQKGEIDGVFVRHDATTRTADEMSLKELRVEGSGRGYDSMICRGLEITNESAELLCKAMYESASANAVDETARQLIKMVGIAQLKKWGLLIERGERLFATNAYALLAGSDLFSPIVKCAVFKGVTRSIFVDRRHFFAPVQQQIEESYKWVLSKINLGGSVKNGVHRHDEYEIPPSAIRELIVNAIAHRSYVNGEESSITIALYDDRLEITSPGRLPHGVSIEKMREGCSECRNKSLVQALAYMNFIEDWGSGIPRVCAELKAAGLKDLEITEWPNAVRMVIFRQNARKVAVSDGKKEKSEQIVDVMRNNPNISVAAIVTAIGGGKRSVERLIAELKKNGAIKRVGGPYGGHWEIVEM